MKKKYYDDSVELQRVILYNSSHLKCPRCNSLHSTCIEPRNFHNYSIQSGPKYNKILIYKCGTCDFTWSYKFRTKYQKRLFLFTVIRDVIKIVKPTVFIAIVLFIIIHILS